MPARHVQQVADLGRLGGLLEQFAQQRVGRLLAEVGAPAGQVPAPGPRVALGDPDKQVLLTRIAEGYPGAGRCGSAAPACPDR